jgi:hypothetical protein
MNRHGVLRYIDDISSTTHISSVLLVAYTVVVEGSQFGLPKVGPVDRVTSSPVFVLAKQITWDQQ